MASISKQKSLTKTTVICYKCKASADKKDTIICSKCQKCYEFDCIGLSEKIYRLMDISKRQNWKCPPCSQTLKRTNNTNFEQSKVITRKMAIANQQTTKETLASTLSSVTKSPSPKQSPDADQNSHILTRGDISSLDDSCIASKILSKSVDHTLLNNSTTEYELREELNQLKIRLLSTESELENVIFENNSLKRNIVKLEKEMILLKTLCQSPHTKDENVKPEKRLSLPPSCCSTPIKQSTHKTTISHIKSKEKNTPNSLQKNQADELRGQSPFTCPNTKEPQSKRNKICLISSNKRNKVLSIAKASFSNYDVCHYLKPDCDIRNLIEGLQAKVENYNENDYCIILIGDEDFKHTKNYVDLILTLREALIAINFTNIILCLPTFRCTNYSTMFNFRIETFNNLLYLDNHTHNYAEILDSNFNLTYDYDMFNKRFGTLNNRGLKQIFDDITQIIYSDSDHIDVVLESEQISHNSLGKTKQNTDFFRLQ